MTQPTSTPSRLARANQARYPREALADVPASLARRYFEERGAECQVIDRVRRRVVVRASDLCTDPPPRRSYQLILCRNVVIYFGRAMQERVFLDFAEALAPGGFLVLGKVEIAVGAEPETCSRCWTRASGSTGGQREWPGSGGPGSGSGRRAG